jgi:hypothetical protein
MMKKKLKLDMERLTVDSFAAVDGDAGGKGTVYGAQLGGGCTIWDTCDCPTAYYRCVEFMFTDYSCDYGTVPPVTGRC